LKKRKAKEWGAQKRVTPGEADKNGKKKKMTDASEPWHVRMKDRQIFKGKKERGKRGEKLTNKGGNQGNTRVNRKIKSASPPFA